MVTLYVAAPGLPGTGERTPDAGAEHADGSTPRRDALAPPGPHRGAARRRGRPEEAATRMLRIASPAAGAAASRRPSLMTASAPDTPTRPGTSTRATEDRRSGRADDSRFDEVFGADARPAGGAATPAGPHRTLRTARRRWLRAHRARAAGIVLLALLAVSLTVRRAHPAGGRPGHPRPARSGAGGPRKTARDSGAPAAQDPQPTPRRDARP